MSTQAKAQPWFTVELEAGLRSAIETVTAALKDEGFGVLTRIDLHDAFKEKLGVDFRPYTILGACNPQLAHAALAHAPEIGLFLPCNVTLEEIGEERTTVRFVDPVSVLASAETAHTDELAELGADARARLERVVAAVDRSGAL